MFILTDDLRNQVTYFKNRRNDCAHGKSNKIDFAHVDAFWLFIQSNLSKFVVNESQEDLINRIRDHFDRSITPPGEDYSHLVKEIPIAVDYDRLIDFYHEVHQVFSDFPPVLFARNAIEEAGFFNSILDLQEEASSSKLIGYLKTNETLLLNVLRVRPERTLLFRDDPPLIRKLWYDKLFVMYSGEKDLPIYCVMLRNDLIPAAQRAEANEVITRKIGGQLPLRSCHEVLEANGFFDTLKTLAFERNWISRFSWANSNCDLIVYYLTCFNIDAIVAMSLLDTFSVPNYPYELRKTLNIFFQENMAKSNQFRQALQHLNRSFPSILEQPIES